MTDHRVRLILDLVPGSTAAAKRAVADVASGPGGFDPVAEARKQLQGMERRQPVNAALNQLAPMVQPAGGGGIGGLLAGLLGGKGGGGGLAGLLGGAGGGIGGLVGGAGGGAIAAAGPIGAIAAVVGMALAKVKDAALQVVQRFVALTQAMFRFAQVASPGQAQRWTMALQDLQAVLGRTFIPVLEKATQGVRQIADALNSILPSTAQMRDVFRALDPVFADLKRTLVELRPVLTVFVQTELQLLRLSLSLLAVQLRALAKAIEFSPLGLLSKALGGDKTLASSVGAAPRPAQFLQPEDISRQAALAAFQANGPQERTADNTAGANARLDAILAGLKALEQSLPDPLGIKAAGKRAIQGFS